LRAAPAAAVVDDRYRVGNQNRETDSEISARNRGGLDRWRQFDELKKMVRFVVLDRTGHKRSAVNRAPEDRHLSHGLRKRVARTIDPLSPPAVEEIIQREKLSGAIEITRKT
jgi:hypothetical protein